MAMVWEAHFGVMCTGVNWERFLCLSHAQVSLTLSCELYFWYSFNCYHSIQIRHSALGENCIKYGIGYLIIVLKKKTNLIWILNENFFKVIWLQIDKLFDFEYWKKPSQIGIYKGLMCLIGIIWNPIMNLSIIKVRTI